MRGSTAAIPLLILLMTVLCMSAQATPYWGPAEIERWEPQREFGEARSLEEQFPAWDGSSGARSEQDYLEMFTRIVEFLDVWQVHDPVHPEFGGMREGEHLPDIIQTDNTSEAIWVWSRYYELTGDNQYYQNIMDAYTYCMNFPAYAEEGGSNPTTGYYRMYNCGWAVRAEQKYRDMYGDDTYKEYADSCARYIRDNELIRPAYGFYRYVNPPVYSWALGNFYYVGIRRANAEWVAAAAEKARDVKGWIEEEPTILENETWAMSGGATMWGLLRSFFCARPESVDVWVPLYKDYLATWASPGDFQNAWNGWYALGHWATGQALDDAFHIGTHLTITDFLVAEDADLDGGIPGRPEDTDEMDQTWVTNYLAFMGCDQLLPAASRAPDPALAQAALSLICGPQPATADLRLAFDLAQRSEVTLALYDCTGRCITRLAAGPYPPGAHELHWTGRDAAGRPVASGAYLAVLQTAAGREARPVLWVR